MKRTPAEPADLDRGRLARVLARVNPREPVGARLEAASRAFRGHPYTSHPLKGGADVPEELTISLRGFDCVTLVETVLAAAHARTAPAFVDLVRRIRYDHGRVDWRRRNHYTTDWVRRNTRQGFVRELPPGRGGVTRARTLNVLRGLPPRRIRLRATPKRRFWRERDRVQTGDLLLFASTRSNLDVFHLGLAVRDGDRLWLRHASRSRGRVLDQDLRKFLDANRMAGVIVVRPQERGRRG